MITSSDITAQVALIVEACDGEYDVQAIAESLVAEFDLTGDSPSQTLEEVNGRLWALMALHVQDEHLGRARV